MAPPSQEQHFAESYLPGQQQDLPLQEFQQQEQRADQVRGVAGASYEGGEEGRRRSPTTAQMAANLTGVPSYYWDDAYYAHDHDDTSGEEESPVDHTALQLALPPDLRRHSRSSAVPEIMGITPVDNAYVPPAPYYEDRADTDSLESDREPLKQAAQPPGRLEVNNDAMHRPYSFQTASTADAAAAQYRHPQLSRGNLEAGLSAERRPSYGGSLMPGGRARSRSPSTSGGALSRAGSIMRAMSQRVVMISGEGDFVDKQSSRSRSRSPGADGSQPKRGPSPTRADISYHSQTFQTPVEKKGAVEFSYAVPTARFPLQPQGFSNPLKGKSLGIFGPENPLRNGLCNILVNPLTEPLILMLIVLQAILLAVESAPDVFERPRPPRWGSTNIDWAIFALFVVFTVELIAKVIVSGLVVNAEAYADPSTKGHVGERVAEQYRAIFQPQRQKSSRAPRQEAYGPSTLARSFTMMHVPAVASTFEEQQRLHLARRAFLRHGFNRLDFVAVVSFWVSFVIGISGVESQRHLFVFRMLSCLRIIRLLALTKGNLIILRSLKKAAPLLVRVSFLIGFFWIVFAIIGVQSFKSSLSRQCLWINPEDPTNASAGYAPNGGMQFCGGYIDSTTNVTRPWVQAQTRNNLSVLVAGAKKGKGYICPTGSICLQQGNPYNNTVHFDDIAHSMELVFVIMSANTFTDLMYYTMDSDYLPAAIFFAAAIMIMMLWMTNLLIAVITSSFQVIREESKASAFTADQEPLLPEQPERALRAQSALQRVYNRVSWIFVIVIAFGLLTQACRTAHTDGTPRAAFLNTAEMIVTTVLAVEIVLRIVADPGGFWYKADNLFDLGLAIITSVILIPPIRHSGTPYEWLTLFQVLRAYRIVMAVPMTRTLITLVLGNVTGILNLMLFVFLMSFLMAIFAAQLFRGELPRQDDSGEEVRIPFNTIYNSFLGMYQVLSSENWTDILYNVTTYSTHLNTAWVGAIFLIGWFIMSYFVLVNMFIAVIQENFDVSEDVKRVEQVKAFLQRKELGGTSSTLALSKVFTLRKSRPQRDPLDYGPATMEMLLKEAVVREFLDEAMDLESTPSGSETPPREASKGIVKPGILSSVWAKVASTFTSKDPNPFYSSFAFSGPNTVADPRAMAREAVNATANRRQAQRDYLARHPTYNVSLFIFTPSNPIRRWCQALVGPGRGSERIEGAPPNKLVWFTLSAFVYAAVVAMVILACVTTPLYQKQYFDRHTFSILNWFVWTDLAFAIVFTVEAVIKVIADGFFFTPNAYFRSSWGIIDAVVLVTLWINVITLFTNNGAISRAVGAFKALRALRLLNISDSARDTFHSLMVLSAWKILSAALVSISLLIPFAIYGLNLFNGRFIECNDNSSNNITSLVDCQGEYFNTPYSNNWTVLAPRAASNPYYSFDDFASALLILFTITSQEGWVDVSFKAQSVTGKMLQPQSGAAQGNALFFVAFNLLATVFILTLFISVFMRNYTESTGVAFLTAEQRSWLELRKLLRQISPSKSSYDETRNRWKKWCHKRAIEKRGKWYLANTGILVVHLFLLLCEYYTEPEWWKWTRDVLFLTFTLLYMFNVTIRIVGLGWARFRRSTWDLYSLLTVFGAFVTSIMFMSDTIGETYVQLHKFFLVAIVLLLIPRNDALDQLFKTAAASLTTIGNLLATWLVFFLMFAIAMTQSFSLTRFGSSETNNLNLRTVPNALILLFRMSEGEGWNEIMEDFAQIKPPFCVEGSTFYESDCGSTSWARVLFIAWNIISMYIFVNLFVSLIYESFSYVYQRTNGLAVVDRDEIRRFKEAWRSVDPDGTGYISKEAFPRLLGELSGVFEMRIYDLEDSVRQILDDVQTGSGGATGDAQRRRQQSSASTSQYNLDTGVDLKKLNQRLARIDVVQVRERRRRFNIFFEEVMVSADPDRGISFTTVLMILAHYNIISDSKSLRLEEFLRRRARLQRVEEEVRRRVVLGFFDMLYYSRQFKRHMERKRSARMTAVPQLGVPEILVDNEEERATRDAAAAGNRATLTGAFLKADDGRAHHRTWTGSSVDVAAYDQIPSYTSHPLAAPRVAGSLSGASPSWTTEQRQTTWSFDLQGGDLAGGEGLGPGGGELRVNTNVSAGGGSGGDAGGGTGGGSNPSSRRGSSVSPAQVRQMLDDSAWMASIRRNATTRRKSLHGRGH